MSSDIRSLEDRLRGAFERERNALRLPPSVASNVYEALDSEGNRASRGIGGSAFRAVYAGAFVGVVIGIVAVTAAVLLSTGGSDSERAVEPATVQEPGPEVPQVAEQPLVQDNGAFLSVRSHTFERGPAALDAAVEITPRRVDVPSYIPQDLKVSHVSAQVPTDAPERFALSAGYTLPADGRAWRPEMSINWLLDDLKGTYPLRQHEKGGTFEAAGYEWSTSIYQHRDGDSMEVVTTRDDGVMISVWLRVAGGLDRDETLAELKKVVESMQPAIPE